MPPSVPRPVPSSARARPNLAADPAGRPCLPLPPYGAVPLDPLSRLLSCLRSLPVLLLPPLGPTPTSHLKVTVVVPTHRAPPRCLWPNLRFWGGPSPCPSCSHREPSPPSALGPEPGTSMPESALPFAGPCKAGHGEGWQPHHPILEALPGTEQEPSALARGANTTSGAERRPGELLIAKGTRAPVVRVQRLCTRGLGSKPPPCTPAVCPCAGPLPSLRPSAVLCTRRKLRASKTGAGVCGGHRRAQWARWAQWGRADHCSTPPRPPTQRVSLRKR